MMQRCDTVRLGVVVYLMRTGTPVIGSILTKDAAVHNVKQLYYCINPRLFIRGSMR